ncbi:MAG: M28 family peptidase [Marinoscillum sp.]
MKHTSIILLLITMTFSLVAQDKNAKKFAKTITEKDLESYLSVLASDSLEGRETGERGQQMAAEYIAGKFKEFGLKPPVDSPDGKSYFQKYPLKKMTYRTSYLKRGEEKKMNFEDFVYYSKSETLGEEYIDVVFAGLESAESLMKKDLKGKYVALVSKDMSNWRKTLADLKELDLAGVFLFVENEAQFDFVLNRFKRYLDGTRLSTVTDKEDNKIIIGTPALASWVFGQPYASLMESNKTPSARIILNADMLVEDIEVENVLGFLEGTDKPEEVLVITAHYDHIGISDDGQINNGADDDGSGTSTVLELAQAFSTAAAKGVKPKRSILFMTVSGEEKGLLGSEYYSDHPVFPLENTVTNLNVDMVGRIDEEHKDNEEYVYVIGADKLSQELHDVSEKVNKTYTKLELDYTYNDENDPNRYYYRSDHYNFAKKGVPIIFYFNGTHADYHKPTDTIEKINFSVMQKRGLLVFYTAWELANRDDRVKVD